MSEIDRMVEEDLRKMKTLAGQLVTLLCDVALHREKRCKCEDPWPMKYGCVYGSCEIYRCNNCHKVIRVFAGRCYYPYSSPDP
jgi:hypothetical protein